MKLNRTLVILLSILIGLFSSVYPVFIILINIKKIESIYLSFGVIAYLLISILLVIALLLEIIYVFRFILKNEKGIMKFVWILLILVFNIFIIPIYYIKKIDKNSKGLIIDSVLYILALLFYIFILLYGLNTYKDLNDEIIARQKAIEAERNVYTTKDGVVNFTFRHGYKQKEVGEYDLYVINLDKNVVFSAFTYDTTLYEQKTPDDYIKRGIEDLKKGKENFEEYKKQEVIELKDSKITTVEYSGKSEIKTKEKIVKTICIYKISIIQFNNKPDYLVYVVEVVPKAEYKNMSNEINEILKTVSLK